MSDHLRAYFKQFTWSPQPEGGAKPLERRLFKVADLPVRGKHLGFGDAWAAPNDAVTVPVPPGTYEVHVEAFSYGTDGRIARLIVHLPGAAPVRGKAIGEFGVDVATAAVFDADVLEDYMDDDEESWEGWLDEYTTRDFEELDMAGLHPCPDADTAMVYCSTGFGDGSYEVFELLREGRVVGAEAVFLRPDQGFFEDDD